jgi:hypothetical protein
MSEKVLFLTVGGSKDPLETAIKAHKPNHLVLFATEQSMGIADGLAGETYSHEVVSIEHPDGLQDCVKAMGQPLERAARERPGCTLVVDYTGGTKTMSAALCYLAIVSDSTITITTGTRFNNRGVTGGETPVRQAADDLFVEAVALRLPERCLMSTITPRRSVS